MRTGASTAGSTSGPVIPVPKPAGYAANTQVPVDRSRSEIERILRVQGATAFTYGWDAEQAVVMFEIANRRVLFRLPMPDRNDRRFTHTAVTRERRTAEVAEREYEQAIRARWRALLLIIKAKLEAVAAGVVTMETEFMPHVVLPDGSTVAEHVGPKLAEAYASGEMPALLPAPHQGRS